MMTDDYGSPLTFKDGRLNEPDDRFLRLFSDRRQEYKKFDLSEQYCGLDRVNSIRLGNISSRGVQSVQNLLLWWILVQRLYLLLRVTAKDCKKNYHLFHLFKSTEFSGQSGNIVGPSWPVLD